MVLTTLLGKILTLVVNKLASLDPCGVGIEMEADRPGWCDAMNGLPGLLGSSVNETIELKRLADFTLGHLGCIEGNAVELIPHPIGGRLGGGQVKSSDDNIYAGISSIFSRPHPSPPPLGEGTVSLNSTVLALDPFPNKDKPAMNSRADLAASEPM